ncbi:thioredoxin family protein [Thermosipho atlanticus]|uniref:Thioredoxin-related protein n=1 Tax=Thermosipho atlanticus DSM 15807 TaxID=1123380 RepID=A0A1M5T0D8_9BACT|nr:thioredoxin fold domain-containing protein [Thermosipho atlanticus]SHH44241.1 Thioredoxin-related protein [Thermosipho atlanticus DSM 15807]
MKKISFLLIIMLSILVFSYEYTFYDLETAYKISLIENKPLIIYFSSPTCIYCKKFEDEVLSDEKFQNILRASYIFVKINPNTKKTKFLGEEFTNRELFNVFGVRGTPTFVFWNKDQGITTIPGFLPLNDFKKALMYVLRYLYEDYQESFDDYASKNDFYLGAPELIPVNKEDFDFVLNNDKNVEVVESIDEEKNIDVYKTYLTYSKDVGEFLKSKGVLRILLLEEN